MGRVGELESSEEILGFGSILGKGNHEQETFWFPCVGDR